MPANTAFLRALSAALEDDVRVADDEVAPYVADWRGAYTGRAVAVALPRSARAVAHTVRLAKEHGVAVVPQGGNTGLAAGSTPIDVGDAIVLSTSRLNAVRAIDPVGNTIAVDAGVVLIAVHDAANAAGRFFPLSLGAEGSAQIGGLIATNAGGSAVLRYGTMRSLVLGLEVVLADGTLVDGMRALRKDNAGYDWKQLFIGAEGTLGVITGAVLRLFPKPRERATALLGVSDPAVAVDTFVRLRETLGDVLTACELFSDAAVRLRLSHHPSLHFPMGHQPWYVLVEVSSSLPGVRDVVERELQDLAEGGSLNDCVVAESSAQEQALWEWRESIPEAEKRAGPSAKHDVAVAISAISVFIAEATHAVTAAHPGARVLAFGHIGDGNVHFNVLLPDGTSAAQVNETVHVVVKRFRGSITAEHGIGRYRVDELPHHRSAAEMDLMRAVKRALDPSNAMNPGAVLRMR